MRIEWFFTRANLNPLHQRMLCAKFNWNWPSGSGEEIFNLINVILLFHNYLPLEKGRALQLNKLEFPSPKDALCQIWLKLAQRFWRRKMLSKYDHYFAIISPWERERPSFEQIWIPFTHKCFVSIWLKLAQWFESKIGKVYRRTDGRTDRQTTDDMRSVKCNAVDKDLFGSGSVFRDGRLSVRTLLRQA